MPEKKKKKRVRYYLYGSAGQSLPRTDLISACILSEITFPRKEKGDCVCFDLFRNEIEIGDVVDIAFGDPRFLYQCELISKNAADCPVYLYCSPDNIWKFRYRGKFFWAFVRADMRVKKVYKK